MRCLLRAVVAMLLCGASPAPAPACLKKGDKNMKKKGARNMEVTTSGAYKLTSCHNMHYLDTGLGEALLPTFGSGSSVLDLSYRLIQVNSFFLNVLYANNSKVLYILSGTLSGSFSAVSTPIFASTYSKYMLE